MQAQALEWKGAVKLQQVVQRRYVVSRVGRLCAQYQSRHRPRTQYKQSVNHRSSRQLYAAELAASAVEEILSAWQAIGLEGNTTTRSELNQL